MTEKSWFTVGELHAARLPELPASIRNINKLAENWRADPARARKVDRRGGGWEYHVSLLPPGAQLRLRLQFRSPSETAPAVVEPASKGEWERFEALPGKQKDEARRRLDCLAAVDRHVAAGLSLSAAVAVAAKEAAASVRSVFDWRKAVQGLLPSDRLPALAPRYASTSAFAPCHQRAWEALTSDWLRPERPSFSSCYRRVRKLASKNGWLPYPSERALRRRIDAEVPAGVVMLAREGRDKAKRLYPAQTRIRTHFHAVQAVNADGHKLDVFVRLADGRIVRVHLIAMQDLYSGMILGWRISESESKDAVRSMIGDVVATHGIPEKCWLDNGRSFASKWITGGMATRYRFKVRAEEPQGILLSLGVEVHFATPYHGQAKPIERAFRDLADNIAKHPFCAGAYTGNRPDAKPENYGNAAVPLDDFTTFVAQQIAEHNERSGRRAAACGGRSFLETFKASLADPATAIRWPTEAQKSLWLLAAENIRAQRGSGEIHFEDNRYWAPALNQYAGQRVTIRFDPERLHDAVRAYTLDDRLICEAPCIAATGFDDVAAARDHARDRKAHARAVAEQLRLHRKMSADELARLYVPELKAPDRQPMPPAVKRLATGGSARPAPAARPDGDFEARFAAGVAALRDQRLAEAEGEIIPFIPRPPGAA